MAADLNAGRLDPAPRSRGPIRAEGQLHRRDRFEAEIYLDQIKEPVLATQVEINDVMNPDHGGAAMAARWYHPRRTRSSGGRPVVPPAAALTIPYKI